MSQKKIVVATDIILDHLCGERRPSILRVAMGEFFCCTTVFTAIELFALAKGEQERRAASDAMGAMKILGLNSRSAPAYGALFRKYHNRPDEGF